MGAPGVWGLEPCNVRPIAADTRRDMAVSLSPLAFEGGGCSRRMKKLEDTSWSSPSPVPQLRPCKLFLSAVRPIPPQVSGHSTPLTLLSCCHLVSATASATVGKQCCICTDWSRWRPDSLTLSAPAPGQARPMHAINHCQHPSTPCAGLPIY